MFQNGLLKQPEAAHLTRRFFPGYCRKKTSVTSAKIGTRIPADQAI